MFANTHDMTCRITLLRNSLLVADSSSLSACSLRLAVIEDIAEHGAADGPIPVTFTPATSGRGGRIAFSNVGASLQLSPTADCLSVAGLSANADKSSCCQPPPEPSIVDDIDMAASQPQCANIGGAGMCYSVMAIKRLVGLDGPNCCAACAALPTCGAWQVNIEPGSKRNVCALKPVGYKTQPCTNPNVPNTSASGASGRQKPLAPLRAGFPFELRRQDGSYVTARAVVEGATVTLTPEGATVINDVTVRESQSDTSGPFVGYRYAWQPFPLCVLTNGDGLPAAPVATDGAM